MNYSEATYSRSEKGSIFKIDRQKLIPVTYRNRGNEPKKIFILRFFNKKTVKLVNEKATRTHKPNSFIRNVYNIR